MKFMSKSKEECQAYIKGVEFGDTSGDYKYCKPYFIERLGLWATHIIEPQSKADAINSIACMMRKDEDFENILIDGSSSDPEISFTYYNRDYFLNIKES